MNDLAYPTDDEILCKILLYGHESLSDSKNTVILANSIKFINKTKRFEKLEAFLEM